MRWGYEEVGVFEELAVEVTGEGALEARRGRRRRGDHPSAEGTGGAESEPSMNA